MFFVCVGYGNRLQIGLSRCYWATTIKSLYFALHKSTIRYNYGNVGQGITVGRPMA
eukprot:SAG11_NODE_39748_length_222_cov_118.861789_1_plen_55_part_01